MEDNAKTYEIGFVVKKESDKEEILKILNKHKIVIADDSLFERAKLAYPIKKEGFGFFGSIFFSTSAEMIKEINKELKMNPHILRFLISNSSGQKSFSRQDERRERTRARTREGAADALLKPAEPIKIEERKRALEPAPVRELSNEALEKKLEEILRGE